jgi:membrane protein YqaA with SNARE-associated domain
VALENLVPPIPSELVLAMAGYLAGEGRVNVVLVLIAATAGSVVGALALYWLGYALGEDRLRRWLDRIPLVDADDLDKADRWFERHEKSAVLFGRCAPVVRSLVSIPAGANHMPLGQFTVFTAIGSGVWNAIFVGGGTRSARSGSRSSGTATGSTTRSGVLRDRHHELDHQEAPQTRHHPLTPLRRVFLRDLGVVVYLRNWNQLTFTKSAGWPLEKVRNTVCRPRRSWTLPGTDRQDCQPPVLPIAKLPIGALPRLSMRTWTSR